MTWEVRHGECIALMRAMPDASVDAVVTDPPYELGFMGKSWDASGIAFNVEVWAEALRVLKPGGHLLAFSGSRTYHRMACAIEDAGFHVRDQIMWLYGSGFPKSFDVSKAIDKAAGAEREVVGVRHLTGYGKANVLNGQKARNVTEFAQTSDTPATDDARRWSGWGTALKPAHEPICMARKPLDGTVAANVLKYGTGAINVDGCRVGTESTIVQRAGPSADLGYNKGGSMPSRTGSEAGRWPANVLHDGSDEATDGLRDAARYFYCAKASRADREHGCEDFSLKTSYSAMNSRNGTGERFDGQQTAMRGNPHPTVKPTELMRYLCRLVTPPGGLVLDPFTGSGSTGRGAVMDGFRFIGCEQSEEYVAIARARIAAAASGQLRLL